LAFAQRIGPSLDQEIDLLRGQRESSRNRVENARARGTELLEI
jgi:hypothetical protein